MSSTNNPKKLSTFKHIILLIKSSKTEKFNRVRFALKSSAFFLLLSVICFSYIFKSLTMPNIFDYHQYLGHLNNIKAIGGFSSFLFFSLLIWSLMYTWNEVLEIRENATEVKQKYKNSFKDNDK